MNGIIISIFTFALLIHTPLQAEEHDHGHEDKAHVQEAQPHDDHEQHGGHQEHGDEHSQEQGADTDHEDHGGDGGHEEGEPIKLTSAQIKQAGIETIIVQHQAEIQTITAPGSVFFNAYQLADVTALVDGVVHARHVRLGDFVKKGQRLVTLTSSSLAQAQADYLRVEAMHRTSKLDLQRLRGLVKDKIISQSRFQKAQSNNQAAFANLAASKAALSSYGMSRKEIKGVVKTKHYGRLILRAPSSGTITSDDFRMGQHIAAGTRLLQIVDESTVWVEVKLSQVTAIRVGQSAVVSTKDRQHTYKAKVINIHHQLDLITRTVGVRLEVQNPQDILHPGMFVQAEIKAGHGEHEVLLLPEEAIQRQGNELIVFVEEEPGHFERREVEVGKTSMGLVPVLKGIKEGEPVVVKGAFVLASELAKSGFAVHNH